ncbi:unnamed protein product [Linum tenue]|uniref:RING-type domain-containing protein n=1 Tax=Linum tenue TaxID=586396 RepID=A0AAV0MCK6_9ROSI|nr:unnamed protein product [Linum tenue]CAI0444591.1 unnamed protein product [Linum tenue]
MDVLSQELHSENLTDISPLLMERTETFRSTDHIIDVPGNVDSSSESTSHGGHSLETFSADSRHSTNSTPSVSQPSTSSSNVSGARSTRRGEAHSRRRSPLNSGLWVSLELALTLSQIIASIVVLSISKDEHPHTPLFVWIIGYASGCLATLPLLYWRYHLRNQGSDQDAAQTRQGSTHINVPAGPFSLSVTRTSGGEDRQPVVGSPRGGQSTAAVNSRYEVKVLVEYFKMGLDCFFAVWFVVGNVWIFGGHSSATDAPNMYRLCIVFLTISCIGYAMPFILCATICCCLPCIISVLGFREDLTQTRGATPESISALPTYKFKSNKRDGNAGDNDGGVVAAGTEKERVISGEDAICCICLGKYANNDELREVPCSHFFHKDCVDKWLKINASCPLCKSEVGESITGSLSGVQT